MTRRRMAVLLIAFLLPACESDSTRLSASGLEIGDLEFNEGFDAGWAKAKEQSKPALVFFTQHG
jgi:hypothetical protein